MPINTSKMDSVNELYTKRDNQVVSFPHGQIITNLRKVRMLNASLQKILKNHKFRAFYAIHRVYMGDARAFKEAPLRMKGRLLLMMSNKYSDSGVKKAWYQWWI